MVSPVGLPEQGYDYDPYGNPRMGDTLKAMTSSVPSRTTSAERQDTGTRERMLEILRTAGCTWEFTTVDFHFANPD